MILVTGGTGLVGSHLLLKLVQSGHKPRATFRTKDKLAVTKKVFLYYAENHETLFETIEWVECDIIDTVAVEQVFENVTHVYHAAALISFEPSDYKNLFKINVEGTANIVNQCIISKVQKLCYVSSIAAIGASIGNEPIKESNEWNDALSYGYALSKHKAEMEVWRGSQEGVPVVIVNPGVILGPGFWKTGSGRFFLAAHKEPNYYLPSGTGIVTIGDVVTAMLRLMTHSTIKNERFILVNQNWSYKKLAETIATGLQTNKPQKELKLWMLSILWKLDWLRSKITGSRRKLSKTTVKIFHHTAVYDNSKIQSHLNDFQFEDLEEKVLKYAAMFLKEQAL